MTLKGKIAVGLAIAVLASAAVTGIAFLTDRQKVAAEEPGLYVGGEKVEDPGVMLTVNGQDIGFDEYRYYYMLNKTYGEMSGGADMWDTDYDGSLALQLRKSTEQTLLQVYSWLKIAQDEGISLTDAEKQEIQDTLAEQKEELGEEGFAKNLSSMFFTDEEMYLRITEEQKLVKKAQDELKARYAAEIEENLDDSYLTAKHILISFDGINAGAQPDESAAQSPEEDLLDAVGNAVSTGGESAPASAQSEVQKSSQVDVNIGDSAAQSTADSTAANAAASQPQSAAAAGAEMTQEQKEAAALEMATQLLQQLRAAQANGADVNTMFDQMVKDFGADPGMEQNPGGYTFGEGEMVQEFYDGAKALQPGEISEPIRTDYGYHIILRMPLDREAIGNGDPEAAIEQAASAKMSAEAKTVQDSLEVAYGAYYDEVTPGGIR